VTTWSYDAACQLQSEWRTGSTVNFRTTYAYDPAGNRLWVEDLAAGLTTYTHDEANQMRWAVSTDAVTSYLYDTCGNLTTETEGAAVTGYDWDETGRMDEAEPMAGGTVQMVYVVATT
jgi:YD repeat-containing protein